MLICVVIIGEIYGFEFLKVIFFLGKEIVLVCLESIYS